MERRIFLTGAAIGAVGSGMSLPSNAATAASTDRTYMTNLLYRIAEPVLSSMARGELSKTMPIEVSPTWDGRDRRVAYMEAFARLLAGIAPWLGLPDDASQEGRMRMRLREWALSAIAHSVDPKSPDYLLWRHEAQPLVDAAYLATALMRAPHALWKPLDAVTKRRIIEELTLMRRVNPPYTNWLLFPAINEAFLNLVGAQYDPLRITSVLREIDEWYVGDGWIRDGEKFHMDYYNSFVFHPMLLHVLESLVVTGEVFSPSESETRYAQALQRAQRHAEYLERIISPTGTFPPQGRSMTYRTSAFQPLSMLAWQRKMPKKLSEGQVRGALTAVHHAIFDNPTNFGPDGFLRLGFAGYQPEIADWYSNNGSMYITSAGFLHLGLSANDSFWTMADAGWTQKRAFANEHFPKDYYVTF